MLTRTRCIQLVVIAAVGIAALSGCASSGGDGATATTTTALVLPNSNGVMTTAPTTAPAGASTTTVVFPDEDADIHAEPATIDPFLVWRTAAAVGDVITIRDQVGTAMSLKAAADLSSLATRYYLAITNGEGTERFPADWVENVRPAVFPVDVVVVGSTSWPDGPGYARSLVFSRPRPQAGQPASARFETSVLWWAQAPDGTWVPADPATVPAITVDGLPDSARDAYQDHGHGEEAVGD